MEKRALLLYLGFVALTCTGRSIQPNASSTLNSTEIDIEDTRNIPNSRKEVYYLDTPETSLPGTGSSYRNCDLANEIYEKALSLVNKFTAANSKNTPLLDLNETGTTTPIKFSFYISGLLTVDESASDFTIIGGAEIQVLSPIHWDYYGSCGLHDLGWMNSVDPTKVWWPMIYSKHLKDYKSLANNEPPLATLYYTGFFVLLPYGYPWMVFTCQFTPSYYPFDTQLCQIEYLVYGQRSLYTNIAETYCYPWKYKRVNIEWDFLACSAEVDGPSYLRTVTLSFLLKRRPQLNVLMVVLPAFLLALSNPVIFLIPAQAAEKSGIGLAFLLTFFVFLQSITATVPKSTSLPYISTFLLVLISINCAALGLAAWLLLLKDEKTATWWNRIFLAAMIVIEVIAVCGMAAVFVTAPAPSCKDDYENPSDWCVWQDKNYTFT